MSSPALRGSSMGSCAWPAESSRKRRSEEEHPVPPSRARRALGGGAGRGRARSERSGRRPVAPQLARESRRRGADPASERAGARSLTVRAGAAVILLFAAVGPASTAQVRVERGRYLAHGVCECFECHTPLEDNDLVQPIASKLGAGDILDKKHRQVAPNITPDLETGAGRWTDAQLIRAIREGIGHDGRRLGLSMPYPAFSILTDDD